MATTAVAGDSAMRWESAIRWDSAMGTHLLGRSSQADAPTPRGPSALGPSARGPDVSAPGTPSAKGWGCTGRRVRMSTEYVTTETLEITLEEVDKH